MEREGKWEPHVTGEYLRDCQTIRLNAALYKIRLARMGGANKNKPVAPCEAAEDVPTVKPTA